MGLLGSITGAVSDLWDETAGSVVNKVGKAIGDTLDALGIKDELLMLAAAFESIPGVGELAPLEYLDDILEGDIQFAEALQIAQWAMSGPMGGGMPGLGNMSSLSGLGEAAGIDLGPIGDIQKLANMDLGSVEGLAGLGNMAGIDMGPIDDFSKLANMDFTSVEGLVGLGEMAGLELGGYGPKEMSLLFDAVSGNRDLDDPDVKAMFVSNIRTQLGYANV